MGGDLIKDSFPEEVTPKLRGGSIGRGDNGRVLQGEGCSVRRCDRQNEDGKGHRKSAWGSTGHRKFGAEAGGG